MGIGLIVQGTPENLERVPKVQSAIRAESLRQKDGAHFFCMSVVMHSYVYAVAFSSERSIASFFLFLGVWTDIGFNFSKKERRKETWKRFWMLC